MKIVINACYGGFGLSDAGVRLYASKKGLTLYPETTKYGYEIYWTVPENERPQEPQNWNQASMEDRIAYNEAYSECNISDRDIPRDDQDLVDVVDELQKAAFGECAELKVVEIPDDVDWQIEEYDGFEHVAEKHRTWG